MTLIGPASLTFGEEETDYGDYLTSIQRTTATPVTVTGINRDFSGIPRSGNAVVISGVEETLAQGTLWRWLYDHAGERDVPMAWSTQSDGGASWTGTIAVVPDPSQGGQANQHGTFNVTIPLTEKPTLVDPVTP